MPWKLWFKFILLSFDLTFRSKESVFISFNIKRALRSIQIRDCTARRRFPAFKFERPIRIPNKFIQIRVQYAKQQFVLCFPL